MKQPDLASGDQADLGVEFVVEVTVDQGDHGVDDYAGEQADLGVEFVAEATLDQGGSVRSPAS